MIIAIDGPAGSGKSSVARGVAQALGYRYLDSGAMYRCVGLASLRQGRPAAEIAPELDIELGSCVLLDGADVSKQIRTPEVSDAASRVATDPVVRNALVAKQRALLQSGDWVAEGRDIGTVVAPDADLKVFLTATPQERARRRAAEHGGEPDDVALELAQRDERDSEREHSPLRASENAVELDTTGLSLDAVVARVVELAGARAGARG